VFLSHQGRREVASDQAPHHCRNSHEESLVLTLTSDKLTRMAITTTEHDPPPVRIGIVGAGPWATIYHAPIFSACSDTVVAGVWARRADAAATLAEAHAAPAYTSFDELLDNVDALSFAVPPPIQASLAERGARSGKALLLEKPLALDLESARSLARVVEETGVPTQLLLTWRYAPRVRQFLNEISGRRALGAQARFMTGGFLGGPFATPWRLEHGAVMDLGPHVIDFLDAALGPVVEISARGSRRDWVSLSLRHESGAVSQAAITATCALDDVRAGAEVYFDDGVSTIDTTTMSVSAASTVASEFAAVVRSGRPHALDVQRGLYLQELLTTAAADIP